MSSIFFIVLVAVVVVGNATASSRHKQTRGTADVQKTDKCEGRRDRSECPIHIANGFCSREGITDEQRTDMQIIPQEHLWIRQPNRTFNGALFYRMILDNARNRQSNKKGRM
ncbi:hypothetical protein V3C99_014624 [Haemonchus contortus]|uniref:Secreted protein n=1 Tax=Haemonchus contortus TaxID=6289 RepID=A0A7I4YUT8_HAECO